MLQKVVLTRIILTTTILILFLIITEGDCCVYDENSGIVNCPDGRSEPPRSYPNLNWSNEPICKNFQIELAPPGTFRERPAVGYPGTGSARLLDLITAATGYYSGIIKSDFLELHKISDPSAAGPELNVQNPRKTPKFWHVTKPGNGRTLLQFSYYNGYNLLNHKRSFRYSEKLFTNFGGILFIRNPWDSFISFKQLMDDTMMVDDRKVLSSEVMNFARGWVKLAKTWISKSAPNDLLVVQYEKMLENPRSELVRIMEYLKVPVSQERLDCLEKFPLDENKPQPLRKGTTAPVGSIFDGLNEVNNFLQRSIKDLNKELGNRGTVLDYEVPTAASAFPLDKPSNEL